MHVYRTWAYPFDGCNTEALGVHYAPFIVSHLIGPGSTLPFLWDGKKKTLGLTQQNVQDTLPNIGDGVSFVANKKNLHDPFDSILKKTKGFQKNQPCRSTRFHCYFLHLSTSFLIL
jgi:hypothetical protein